MRITRLGQGVDATRRLAPEAIERTVAVLREYREVMDRFGVERVRMTATSAARDAANRDEFFAAAEAVVGVRPELLSGDEEGRLSFAGATAELDPGRRAVPGRRHRRRLDRVRGRDPAARAGVVRSTSAACASPRSSCTATRPGPRSCRQAALGRAMTYLDDVAASCPRLDAEAGWSAWPARSPPWPRSRSGLPAYDRDRIHHFVLTRAAAEDVFRTLATEARADRIHNPGLEEGAGRRDRRRRGRAGRHHAPLRVRRVPGVSEADILDGLAMTPSDWSRRVRWRPSRR